MLAAETVDAGVHAREQGVVLVEFAAAAGLHGTVLGNPALRQGSVFVFPFGQGDDFIVVRRIGLERDETGCRLAISSIRSAAAA